MLSCLYNGQRINSINIMEEASYEYRKQIKKAGCRKELVCEDCGQPVILKAGEVRQSHFAHWRGFNELCPYQEYSSKETDAHKKCKALVYNLMKQYYPDELVQVEYAAIPSRRSDIFIEFHSGEKLAIDIHRGSISTVKWDSKHIDYKNAGITDLWFILGQPYDRKERNMPFFHQIMLNENLDNTAVFIHPVSERITLVKNIVYRDVRDSKEHSRIFKKEYPLEDIRILPTGKIECDFNALYDEAKEDFMGIFRDYSSEDPQTVAGSNDPSMDATWGQISLFTGPYNTNGAISKKKQENADNRLSDADMARNEKYIWLHLELIMAGNNKKIHIEKLANKILDEDCYGLFVNIRDTMLAANNKRGYEACVAVLNRAKRMRK